MSDTLVWWSITGIGCGRPGGRRDCRSRDATFQVRALMERKVTKKTLERLELDPRPEDRVDVELVVALCRVYRVDIVEVSPLIGERAKRFVVLLRGNRTGRDDASDVTVRYQPAAA